MTQSWKHGRWTLAPVAGLDFGATVAGGAGVAQSVEVANAGEFPITVRITSAKAATPVRRPTAVLHFVSKGTVKNHTENRHIMSLAASLVALSLKV